MKSAVCGVWVYQQQQLQQTTVVSSRPNNNTDPAEYKKYFQLCRRQDLSRTGFEVGGKICRARSKDCDNESR